MHSYWSNILYYDLWKKTNLRLTCPIFQWSPNFHEKSVEISYCLNKQVINTMFWFMHQSMPTKTDPESSCVGPFCRCGVGFKGQKGAHVDMSRSSRPRPGMKEHVKRAIITRVSHGPFSEGGIGIGRIHGMLQNGFTRTIIPFRYGR